jgi:hypothetical protein
MLALVVLSALHSAIASHYSDSLRLSGTQSFQAVALLQANAPKASGDTEQVVIAVDHGRVTDSPVRARVEAMLAAVGRLAHLTEHRLAVRRPGRAA